MNPAVPRRAPRPLDGVRLSTRHAMKGLRLAGFGLVLAAGVACAAPEDDHLRLVNYFKHKHADVKVADYIYGAFAYDPDAREHYDGVMAFPPYAGALAEGERLWRTPFGNGRTYADCLPDGGRMIAGNYPMFDEARGRVVTFEMALNDCRVANGEAPYTYDDAATLGVLAAYARSLSDGMRMNVRVDGAAALQAYEDGKRTFYRRVGQLNYSCASCHIDGAGNRLGAELLSPVLGQATHWPVFRAGERLETLHDRYSSCFRRARHVPDAAGSTRYNNLEYFHSYLSNGMEMKASVYRK